MRESIVSSTLRSRDWASSTITKASWRERPRMWVSGSTSSMPRESTSSMTFWDTIEPSVSKTAWPQRSEEHTSELQSRFDLVCRLLLEKKKKKIKTVNIKYSMKNTTMYA